jgi:Zn-finger nucleic acid-binding protein
MSVIQSTNSTITKCPKCLSTAVDGGELAESPASCRVCGWVGVTAELQASTFQHDYGSEAEIMEQFFRATRNVIMAGLASQLGELLVRFGFLDPRWPADRLKRVSIRYAIAVARAIVDGIFKERLQLEKDERKIGGKPYGTA